VRVYPRPSEKIVSGTFAAAVHILFAAFLIVGLSWQKQYQAQPNIVDLWATLPGPAVSRPRAPPPPVPVEMPKSVELPVPPLPEAPPIAKPDIALRDKAVETAQALQKKREQKIEAVQKQQQVIEAQEQLAREEDEARQTLAAQQASAQQAEIDKYMTGIKNRIKGFIVEPPNLQGNPEAELDVRILPGGEVLVTRLTHSSGNALYDNAVERAILKAQPLPVPPPDSPIFDKFRELTLTFRPQEQ
jgi:colicin import membrane protein